jgi:peptide/nickel transport system substrate-binding protein
MVGRRILAGMALLGLTAGLASAAPEKQGGIFRIGLMGASTQVDPQLAYVTTSWWLEYATAAKLYNYPDEAGQAGGLLRPEVASGFAVSGNGRTYTFTIRKGYRFSDGAPVTAQNFAYAIKRAKDPDLASPASAFITGITSARAEGTRLVIRLTRSDPSLLKTLAMPFFQATSTELPLKTEVTTGYPSAGPYYFAANQVNTLTSLRKNRHWGGHRPQHLDGVDVHWNQTENVEPPFDLTTPPAADIPKLIERFGINRTRFWRMPVNCLGFIPFNNSNGIFAGNAQLRKAVNWALDRTEYFGGSYTVTPWTHLLTPLTPGAVTAKKKQPYGRRANMAKARKLAAGHLRDGRITVAYRSSGTVKPQQAQIVRKALIQLGFDPAKIVMKGVTGAEIFDAPGVDMAVSMGWCSDYQNEGSALHSILGLAHFAGYDAKIAAAERLQPNQRAKALGKLDIEVMKNVAPLAPMAYYNNLFFFSNRVDPRSLVYNPTYTNFSIPSLALK